MSAEVKKEIQLEIGHILFIDIVGYSKLLINEQGALLHTLNQIVRSTDQFRSAEAAGRLIKIPTGDGMALIFYNNPQAPVECALEISRAVKTHPNLRLRMGVHSGPVSGVIDVNGQANLTGAGLNLAQRVMNCGDAGHILLSKHVAEDLEAYEQWRPLLHDLGACEVKHGARVPIVNLYADQAGNPQLPKKFQALKKRSALMRCAVATAALLALAVIVAGTAMLSRYRVRSTLAAPEKSIAVLPFENLSDEKQNAFFTDGVQDEILANLAKVADLKVISRTSVLLYKSGNPRNLREIGQQLGVAHVLEGSVQRSINRVRVTAQLIDARTDAHLWAETYDRDLADVFAIQSEIAKTIADHLRAKLSPTEKTAIEQRPTSDLAAFELYVRATALMDAATLSQTPKDNLLQAVNFLGQAIDRDPAFLLAYCKLAGAHDLLYLLGIDHTPERLALADAAVNNAMRLGSDSGDAHLAMAQHLYSKLDYDRARAEIAVAHRTLPNNPRTFELSGYIDRRQGRWPESARNLERALQLDPRNVFTLQQISLSYNILRAYAREAAALDRVLVLKPNDLDTRIERAQVDLDWRADTKPLRALIEALLVEDTASAKPLAGIRIRLAFCERDSKAAEHALAALGDDTFGPNAIQFSRAFGEGLVARMKDDAAAPHTAFTAARATQEQIVRAQPDYAPALCVLGLIDAGLGRKDDALREGRRAIELLPVAKDSINGSAIIGFFAVICAWVGEKDLALEKLRMAVQLPGTLSYGSLRLHPQWDSLRGDPRFEKIVASLAPKTADK